MAGREAASINFGNLVNWNFAGSDEGGHRAAAIYTLIETRQAQRRRPAGLARRRARPIARSSSQANRRSIALELAPAEPRR